MTKKRINNLPVIVEVSLDELKEMRKVALVTTPSALAVAQGLLSQLDIVHKFFIEAVVKSQLEEMASKFSSGVEVIYGVGGGRAMDGAKYLAAKKGLELRVVPTILSTDAFLTDSVGVRNRGCVSYLPAKHPDTVCIDYYLLSQAPARFNISGCSDVLSIFTALFDWEYANQRNKISKNEKLDPSIADAAQSILNELLGRGEIVGENKEKGLRILLRLLTMEVQLCQFYGNSRPEEGGEHFFTYCVENRMPPFLHGEMVAFGILITAFVQGQDPRKARDFMEKVGLNYKPLGLKRGIVTKTLQELPEYVKNHGLSYGIYNDFDYQSDEKRIKEFLDKLGF